MKIKTHTIDYKKCECSKNYVLHQIGWAIDYENKIYKEISTCMKCKKETERNLSEKEVFAEVYDEHYTRK